MFEEAKDIQELNKLRQQAIRNKETSIDLINQAYALKKSELQNSFAEEVDFSAVNQILLTPLKPPKINVSICMQKEEVGASYDNNTLNIKMPNAIFAIPTTDTKGFPLISNTFTIKLDEGIPKFLIK